MNNEIIPSEKKCKRDNVMCSTMIVHLKIPQAFNYFIKTNKKIYELMWIFTTLFIPKRTPPFKPPCKYISSYIVLPPNCPERDIGYFSITTKNIIFHVD